ncbi:hypothetical protein [Rhodopirellula bahusiensis]|uniref:MFS transporter n=1 Tax=Rhodopirellula bahusiensis TaxID=2014065 RepID=A0A2G1W249_9BACT|nr:hypothetical protein [Rhodopirellula bahusiensis]PHQ33051.1 hypothetical protein CEE69_22805 [Rhodopirellula bahusiensis]
MNPPRQVLLPLFGFTFLTSATYSVARALGVSLFIARMGSDALPVALVASAVTVIAVSAITHLVNQHFPARFSVIGSWIGLASITAWLTAMISVEHHSFFLLGALYVLAEVRGCVNTIYATTLANNAFASSTSKRPFVLIAAGAPIAGIVMGTVMGYEASVIEDTTWLKIIIGLDVATIILLSWIPKTSTAKTMSTVESRSRIKRSKQLVQKGIRSMKRIPASPSAYRYRYGLVSLIAFNVFAVTMVDYQWKVIAGDHLIAEDELLTYFAGFYAVNDILIVLVQFTVATKLLDRFGIGMPLCAYPLLLSILGLIALINQSHSVLILLFTLGQGLTVLKRSLYDPGLTSAYAILPQNIRNETILLIKGVVKPLIEAAVAVGLLFLASRMTTNQITSTWLAALIPWFLLSSWVSSTYEKWAPTQPGKEPTSELKLSEQ